MQYMNPDSIARCVTVGGTSFDVGGCGVQER